MSASALPYRRSQPSWSKATPEEVTDQIFKFARRGLSPSQIGVILRDSHGVPQVKSVTGNKILRILKTNGASNGGPFDKAGRALTCRSWPVHPRGPLPPHQEGRLRPKAPRAKPSRQGRQVVSCPRHPPIRTVLTRSRMILIESRIHRLARYYIKTQQVPPTFKYEAATASTLVA